MPNNERVERREVDVSASVEARDRMVETANRMSLRDHMKHTGSNEWLVYFNKKYDIS